jgi:hypothetical protein
MFDDQNKYSKSDAGKSPDWKPEDMFEKTEGSPSETLFLRNPCLLTQAVLFRLWMLENCNQKCRLRLRR